MIALLRQTDSLYSRLLASHLQIAGMAALLLCVCLTMVAYFQHGSAVIADVRLPSSLLSARIVNGIEESNSHLRSWVLLRFADRAANRERNWSEQIEPSVNELEALASDDELASISALRLKVSRLKESQWWVEEIATTVGNNPARLIYERDLLPNFEQIQQAVVGLSGNPTDSRDVSEIRLAAAMTHQSLSEAIRQLSEAVSTGSVTEIREFRDGSRHVQEMLQVLSEQIAPDDDTRGLLNWILREYRVYEQLANQTIAIRQSDDWNRALHILRTETEPLAADVKIALATLQAGHNNLLQEDVARNALIGQVSTIVTLSMIIGLGIVAWAVARTKSDRLVAPIVALAEATEQLAESAEPRVQLPVKGPREIAHLTERFNYMGRELTTRTEDLQHANRELQAYTHVITHDLKPPLINIKGHAGLIKTQLQELESVAGDSDVPEQGVRDAVLRTIAQDIPESVKFIDLSIAKTNTLVGGVLDNSRMLFRELSLEDIDMNKLVEQVVSLFSHRLDGVDFVCARLPVIRTDRFLMEHIFSNLIDNALKYLDPNRAGKIEIGSKAVNDGIRFWVRDNGIGVSNPKVDVFKLFRQEDEKNSGAGVGLALVKTMLSKLGGRIWHSPNEGGGTTFSFVIPSESG